MPKPKASNPRQGSPVPIVKPISKTAVNQTTNTQSIPPLISSTTYAITLLASFWYTLTKGNLVTEPIKTLSENILPLVLIQIFYCISGGLDQLQQTKTNKKNDINYGLSTKISTAILATILSLAMSILVFGLLILFGAPAISNVAETFLCSVHISILSVQPLVFVYNLDSKIWKDIISVKLPLNGVYGASVGTWLGAWLGAVPIPLDWDRPWQRWPVTIVAGAYFGTSIGTLIGAIYRQLRN